MPWIVAQLGAREHYAIPRVLHRKNNLMRFYTEAWRNPLLYHSSLQSRYHPDLSTAPVTVFTTNFIAHSLQHKLKSLCPPPFSPRSSNPYDQFITTGQWFGKKVLNHLERIHSGNRLPTSNSRTPIFFSYDTTALEPATYAKSLDWPVIVNQIDPGLTEFRIVQEENERWPGWALAPLQVTDAYNERRQQEWDLADRIVVNSPWSQKALIEQGVARDKLVIIPLAFETSRAQGTATEEPVTEVSSEIKNPEPTRCPPASALRSDLRILFLGQVILRKGIQYLVEAAKSLISANVHFDIVGPFGISEHAIRSAPPNMTFHGRCPREKAKEFYQHADLFVLPTLSDGFAITQIEAMAHGLPVIATPCCGEVVQHNINGKIIPPRAPQGLAEVIMEYAVNREMLNAHSEAALNRVQDFSLNHLGKNLFSAAALL